MAYKILDTCIICAKCDRICPREAIFIGNHIYEINPRKCDECKNESEPLCVIVCPVNAIIKENKKTNDDNKK